MTWLLVSLLALGQIQYKSGVDVTPAYEGWTHNPDGTYSFYFGYLNRNYEEELEIPVGPNNVVEPGGDRGQPTHFYPRRQHFAFKVVVPKDWKLDQKVTWTLSIRGKTNTAKGWLQPEWEINKQIVMENLGGEVDDDNEAPVVTGSPAQTVTLPAAATLSVTVKDDGRPKPKKQATGQLKVFWSQFRSPGPVTFEPSDASAENGKPLTSTTKATFKVPGVYILRAIATDGSLETPYDITVTVH